MPRILIAGAPTGCWTNLGDEAILEGMTQSLRTSMPNALLSVVSSNPPGFLAAHDITDVPYADVAALARAVNSSDLVMLGGGSIFFDYWGCDPRTVLTPRHEGLSLWAGVALLAASARRPLMVYGAGVGPLRSAAGRLLAAVTFELADVVTLRDIMSRQTLHSLGIDVAASVTGDPALAVDVPRAAPPDLPRPWIGVALRPWDLDVDAIHWQRETAAALDRFLETNGGTAVFVPSHRAVDWPLTDDAAAAEAVTAFMNRRNQTRVIDAGRPWRERAAMLAGCDLVLAMRYHAALFALASGVPTVGLSYDPKVDGLFQAWNADAIVRLPDVSRDALSRLLDQAWRRGSEESPKLQLAADDMRTRERENVRQAAHLLKTGAESQAPARRHSPAVRELLTQLGADTAERPPVALDALERLRRLDTREIRIERSTRGRSVAILTNRLLDWETGQPCFGGAERYALELGLLLRDLGFAPTFFQLGTAVTTGDYHGFPVESLSSGDRFSEFEYGVGDAFFRRTADFDHVLYLMPNYASGNMRPDAVVVCHGVWWDHDLYGGQFAFRTPKWYEHLERVFVRPRRVVTVDANSINVVRALFPEAAARMTRIPNWVDIDRFHPPGSLTNGETLVIFPRRAEVVRGPRLVGPILDGVPDDCRFVWVGDGYPEELSILREVAARDPRLTVRTASFDEMPDIYRQAAICVIPTIGSEGQSLACLEAMASGCAVVATHVGGLPELVQEGVTGLLCDPEPDALATAIRRLLRDENLRRRLGTNARGAAEAHSLVQWREQWTSLVEELGWTKNQSSPEPLPMVPAQAMSTPTLRQAYDVVCFSIINWEFRWQRPQQIMSAWARRGRRVFYLRMSDFLPPEGKPFEVKPVRENVWEVRMALPAAFDVYSGSVPETLVGAGLEALRRLCIEFEIKSAASIVEIASWMPLAVRAREEFGWPVVYDCMDDWSHFPGIADRHDLLALEGELVERADVLLVSSRQIAKRWAGRRADLVEVLNASDFEFFQTAAGEDPLADVSGPIAGYFGAIVPWFDITLIAYAAKERPAVTFVLVGDVLDASVEELERLPNVRLTGQQPYRTMPAYLRRFDACLVPFVVSDLTAGMDVVKFYEYISQGKPVVATPIQSIVTYGDYLYLARTPEEFVHQLDRALAEDDAGARKRRIALAREHTWDRRITTIEEAIASKVAPAFGIARLKHEIMRREIELATRSRELSALNSELVAQRERADQAAMEVLRLQSELVRFQSSRLWRMANVYWRGRRLLGRTLKRLPGIGPGAD